MAHGSGFASTAPIADVRSIAELEQWFPLASLEQDTLVLAA
jgi:hypothetical protein